MDHTLVDSVAEFIDRHALLDDGSTVLVAVSGGADSMVCLSLLRRLGYDVHALHANYGLREGADADESLVRRWCEEQSPAVPLAIVSLDAEPRAETEGESLQEAARRLRYDTLAEHALEIDATAVATGHHRDDQAETLLLNLVRGAGPEGLAGMRPTRLLQAAPSVSLVRPLLDVDRSSIEAYAEEENVPWHTDPTNRSLDYDRGVIRSEILPRLEDHFEGVRSSLARSATLVGEYVDQALRPGLKSRMERAYHECEAGGWLSLEPLRDDPTVWRRRLLLEGLQRAIPSAPYSYAVAEELDHLLEAQVGRHVEVGHGTVWRERKGLRFLPDEALPEPILSTDVSWNGKVELNKGVLQVEVLPEPPDTLDTGSSYEEFADAGRLGTDLEVRSWKEGDRFHPLGLDGTKRVSELLTEAQVSSHCRDAVCVLCTSDHIAWVIGHRLDHRVRVRPDTERVARLVFRPHENA